MKTITSALVPTTCLMLAMVPVAACAQSRAETPPAAQKAGRAAGDVTLRQFVSRHEQKLLAADTDGDGKISQAEFAAAAKAGKRDPAERIARLDTNGDGMLDKAEIDAILTRRFKKLDTNGDGVADAAERSAAHAGKGKARAGSDS